MLRTLSSFSEALKTIFETKKSGELFDDSTSRPAPIAHYSDDKKSSIFSNHYALTFELGHGYFAYRCTHPDSIPNEGKACFVNISSDMDYDKLYIVTELRALRRIYHPNITNLFAHYESPVAHRLIMDFMPDSLYKMYSNKGYTEAFIAMIAKQIFSGLLHAHSVGVVHRDLRLHTILQETADLNHSVKVKLACFGKAAFIPRRDIYNTVIASSGPRSVGSTKFYVSRSSRSSKPNDIVPVTPDETPGNDVSGFNNKEVLPATIELPAVQQNELDQVAPVADGSAVASSLKSERAEEEEMMLLAPRNAPSMKSQKLSERVLTSILPSEYNASAMKGYDRITESLFGTEMRPDECSCSPEMLRCLYGPQNDMWSVGCILYQLLTGRPPFADRAESDYQELAERILLGLFPKDCPEWDKLTDPAKDLLCGLLHIDPLQRLSPDEAMAHEWVMQATLYGSDKYTKEVLFPIRTKLALRKKQPSFVVDELRAESRNIDDTMNELLPHVEETDDSRQNDAERQQPDAATDRSSLENEEYRDAAFQFF